MDRIVHPGIEEFKKHVFNIEASGMSIRKWNKVLSSNREDIISKTLEEYLDIREENIGELLD